jgi:hypothetical protein
MGHPTIEMIQRLGPTRPRSVWVGHSCPTDGMGPDMPACIFRYFARVPRASPVLVEWESPHLPSFVISTVADYRESGELRSGGTCLSAAEGTGHPTLEMIQRVGNPPAKRGPASRESREPNKSFAHVRLSFAIVFFTKMDEGGERVLMIAAILAAPEAFQARWQPARPATVAQSPTLCDGRRNHARDR